MEEAQEVLVLAMLKVGAELMLDVPVEVGAAVGESWAEK